MDEDVQRLAATLKAQGIAATEARAIEMAQDILKIEKEVHRLTEEIERLKGQLRFLSDQIAYSTIEVEFRSSAPPARPVRERSQSPFPWINEVGMEHVLSRF